jgi:hypothetical protein
MTTGNDDDVLAAALLQLSGHAEQLADLRTHVNAITSILGRHATVINALDGLDRQVASLADRLTSLADNHPETPAYQPVPAPRWWHLSESERQADVDRLRAWTEHVYQPGYGHLAAALPHCWHLHPLCLYTLDWLSELWSALHLTRERTASTLAAQAEWQTRLLPAAAGQMAREASRCDHRNHTLRHPPSPPNWPGDLRTR